MTNKELTTAILAAGGELYAVGGSVRDELMGRTDHKDRDFVVTGLSLKAVVDVLEQFGRVDLVGKSFGVLKLHTGKEEIDVALPRTERSTGEGHKDFVVDFDHTLPIEEDLGRRDFTMNAIAVRLSDGKMIDPFGGRQAIERKIIHLVHDLAFEEDPLRMLRAVQFAARFKFRVSAETKDAIRKNAHLASTVSGERVFEEIKKVMTRAEFPSIAFNLMKNTGLLKVLFPELQATVGMAQPHKFHDLDVFGHIMAAVDGVPSDKLHVRMAALFHDVAKPITYTNENGEIHFYRHEFKAGPIIKAVMGRLRAPLELTQKMVRLVANHMFALDFDTVTPRAVRRTIARVGEELIFDLVDLRVGDRLASGKPLLSMGKIGRLLSIIERELAEPAFSLEHLAIGGKDLIELGMTPGPEFSVILKGLLEKVLEEKELNTRDSLLKIVKEGMAGA